VLLLKQSACEWIERFKNGGTSITLADVGKLPFTSNTDKDIKYVGGMILDKRRVTTDEVTSHSCQIVYLLDGACPHAVT
jgi:hypothetical protein